MEITRRDFVNSLALSAAAGGFTSLSQEEALARPLNELADNIPTRRLGRTGLVTKALGYGIIFFRPRFGAITPAEGDRLLNTSMDLGINFFEMGRNYGDAETRMSRVIKNRRKDMIISSKSMKRTKEGMAREIDISLATIKTDYLDFYMCHDCSSLVEYDRVVGPDGALEALLEAKKAGKIRFLGYTGHSEMANKSAVLSGLFDAIVAVYNPANRQSEDLIRLCAKQDVAFINMKPFGQGGLLVYEHSKVRQLEEVLTPDECLRFSLSTPGISIVIPGPMKVDYMLENAAVAARFIPMSEAERAGLIARADRIAGGICGVCDQPCNNACPNDIPVSRILSMLEHSYRLHFNKRLQSDQYAMLPRTVLDCDRCGECAKICTQRFDTVRLIGETHKILNEARARSMALS